MRSANNLPLPVNMQPAGIFQQNNRKGIHPVQRGLFAVLLLLVFCIQQFTGTFRYEITVRPTESKQPEMTRQIAAKIRSITGATAEIDLHDKDQLDALNDLGYGAPFIFSEEVDGQVVYYTLDQFAGEPSSENRVSRKSASLPSPSPLSGQSKNDRLLPKFYYWQADLRGIPPQFLNQPGHTVPRRGKVVYLSVPSPPPKTVCSV